MAKQPGWATIKASELANHVATYNVAHARSAGELQSLTDEALIRLGKNLAWALRSAIRRNDTAAQETITAAGRLVKAEMYSRESFVAQEPSEGLLAA